MSESPFLTSSRSVHRTRRLRRRRRTRAVALTLVFLVAIAVLFVMLAHGRGRAGDSPPTRTPARGASHARATKAPAVTAASLRPQATRSRQGMALGPVPLPLTPAAPGEALAVTFHHPPRAGLVFDLDSGRVLWQRDATRILPIASLTKMMTALLVARELPADARVPITRKAVEAAGSRVGLLPRGKRVDAKALLYGLLLPSGNDAAVALAEAVSGSVGRFVARMNEEAANLGLSCTRFASPDGLDDRNSSCAVDLAELASADLAQAELRPTVRSASAILPFPIKGGKLYLYSNNPLLRYRYPGATGLKTGETEAAGLCLVGTAERHGVRLGVVLLHSPALGRQAEYLLDRAFTRVYHQAPVPAPPVPPGR